MRDLLVTVAAALATTAASVLGLGPGPPLATAADPPVASVAFTIAPGEDGSAVETVTVARRDGKHSLTLEREAFEEKPKVETLTISEEEFAAIWAIVKRDKLADFVPDAGSGTAFDYGRRALRIEVCESPKGEPKTNQQTWKRPIKNQDRLHALVPALARLARDKGKDVKLENFQP